MGRKRRNDDNCWPLTEHTSGYIKNRDNSGIAVVFYGNKEWTTELPFKRKYRARAVAIGNAFVWEYKSQRKRKASESPSTVSVAMIPEAAAAMQDIQRMQGEVTIQRKPKLLSEAMTEYIEAILKHAKPITRRDFRQMFAAFFENDLEMNDDSMYNHLKVQLEVLRTRYKNDTLVKHIGNLQKFIGYCQNWKWLSINPLGRLNLPHKDKNKEVIIRSDEETATIVAWFRARIELEKKFIDPRNRTAEQYVNLWQWQDHSGMRINETLDLKWEAALTKQDHLEGRNYVTNTKIVIRQAKNGKDREIPFDMLPELEQVVRAQHQFAGRNEGGYVFPWRDIQLPARALRKCLKELKLPIPPRPIHVWRATFEDRLRRRGYSAEVITQLTGHSLAVYVASYERGLSAEDIAREMKRQLTMLKGEQSSAAST